MKNMKKILALLVAVLMIVASMSVVMAEDPTYSLKIEKAEAGHTYTAYQIFSGTLTNAANTANTDSRLGDVDWGEGISDAGKTAMLTFKGKTYVSAQDLADHIGTTAADAIDFADAVKNYLTGGHTGKLSGTDYTISSLPAGYYVVVDTWTGDGTAEEGKDYKIARMMVQVVGNATVVNKADKPTVEKKLKNQNELVAAYRDANNVAIGDTINYQIKTSVPNMVDYNKGYWFVVKDHMSKGLEYVANSLAITMNGTTVDSSKYTLTVGDYSATDGTDIKVVFKDFKTNFLSHFGEEILITYSATLNSDAVVGTAGNPNNVEIIYSNNPNHDYGGKNEPDSPDDDDVVGKTPKDWVKTYTINLKLKKVDKADASKILPGAKFTIKGYKENDKAVYTETFTEDAAGTYYKLTDNTYTEVAPNPLTASKYANDGKMYKLTVNNNIVKEVVPVSLEATTDESGLIVLPKIAAGRYVFTETEAPKGYNLLTESITIDIMVDTNQVTWSDGTSVASDLTVTDANTAATWSATGATLNGDTFEFTVENGQGAELPETGGMGTTLLYVGGSILVILAAVLLITKRRMSSEE